ncbi:LOW QUALITY PROTEIN: hypothetical protein CVT26_002791 [Gymnopilus dilepis]|uniref:Uncharacterized protein n=1 Tax=Gymnopilus dilepis TaxID=231916 RepID=A0A409Y379_9AGAR|nr:LOW QUALITY PROTEIN: hypothetical protein CVT26_002791 [Gymnopilus dilepis]
MGIPGLARQDKTVEAAATSQAAPGNVELPTRAASVMQQTCNGDNGDEERENKEATKRRRVVKAMYARWSWQPRAVVESGSTPTRRVEWHTRGRGGHVVEEAEGGGGFDGDGGDSERGGGGHVPWSALLDEAALAAATSHRASRGAKDGQP